MLVSQFIKFLENNQILHTALGIIVATTVTDFITVFNEILIDPIIENYSGYNKNKIVKIFGIKIKIGVLMIEIINFFIVLFLVFIIVKYVLKHKGPIPGV